MESQLTAHCPVSFYGPAAEPSAISLCQGDPATAEGSAPTIKDVGPHHHRSRRVFDLTDKAEAPTRHPCAPSVDWKHRLTLSAVDRDAECILFSRPEWMKCGSATTFGDVIRSFRARGAIARNDIGEHG